MRVLQVIGFISLMHIAYSPILYLQQTNIYWIDWHHLYHRVILLKLLEVKPE